MEFLLWKEHWRNWTENNPPTSKAADENEESCPKNEMPNSSTRAINSCSSDIFPNIFTLLAILATLPVTTCEPERIFSSVERTLTSIRSTMGEERMESLLMIQAHRDDLPSTEEVINIFSNKKRRVPLIL